MTQPRSLLLGVAGIALILLVAGLAVGNQPLWQASLPIAAVSFAIGLGGIPKLAGYQFTAWIIAAVCAAMCYPQYFLQLGPFDFGVIQIPTIDLGNEWAILVIVQLVMFSMGTKMSLHDFVGVAKMPYPVFIGIALQFLVMPLTGYALTKVFTFPPEIAAGVVLIGSCSSGLASNVMCYLARADLALSVTLTAVATLMAPLMTSLWMNVLAGDKVEVHFAAMMAHIFKIVLLPIGAALLHDVLRRASPTVKHNVFTLAVVGLGYLVFLGVGGTSHVSRVLSPALFEGTLLLAVAVLAGVAFHLAASTFSSVEKHIHLVSMFGIIYFTAVTTAEGRNNLLSVGLTLIVAAAIHNLVGWILGFGLSSLAGLDRSKAIAVGFEVAMQNGGMASGIASSMGKLGTVGLAAAVFSPWMNVSSSIIANLIRRYAPIEDDQQESPAPQVYESPM
jgi:bile acid:Na+ symporter, BASS family